MSSIKVIFISIMAILVLSFSSSCFSVIETGERGVVLRLGKYSGTLEEGLNIKFPLIDRVVKLPVRDTKYAAKLEVSSSDMQTISVEESLVYSLNTKDVGGIYQKYGNKYEEILIKPTLAEITNSVIAAYPIEQFVEKRSEISDKINQDFTEKVIKDMRADSIRLVNNSIIKEYFERNNSIYLFKEKEIIYIIYKYINDEITDKWWYTININNEDEKEKLVSKIKYGILIY